MQKSFSDYGQEIIFASDQKFHPLIAWSWNCPIISIIYGSYTKSSLLQPQVVRHVTSAEEGKEVHVITFYIRRH